MSIICDMAGGPLGWLYPFEIQPLETRPAGGAVASLMNLLFSFVIGEWHPLSLWTLATQRMGVFANLYLCEPLVGKLKLWRAS